MYNQRINEVTGNQEVDFNGVLLSISEQVKENSNGNKYRLCNIRFTDAQGKEQTILASVYEKNFEKGLKVGEQYLCTAQLDKATKRAYVHVSALPGGNLATGTMFGFVEETVVAAQTVGAIPA